MMTRRNKTEHTQALANYMPGGHLFEASNIGDSNFRQLLRGIASELYNAEGYLHSMEQEYYPDTTVLYLTEWESALGIPDSCFKATGTIYERRRDVMVKLASLGVQTADDFVALAALFGVFITVTAGRDEITFPLIFPVLMFSTLPEARYSIVIEFTVLDTSRFPLTFPFIFGTELIGILECLFNKLKPSNCSVIFQQA